MSTKITRQCYRRHQLTQALRVVEEEIELTDPKHVLIQIHAVALNYRDANILNGTNPWPVSPSGIPCSDGAGVIIAVGGGVTKFAVGQRVSPIFDQNSITGQEQSREWLGGEVDGVLATHVIFPEDKIVEIPAHLTWAEAACLPCAGLTAWNALAYGGSLMAGKTILIQGQDSFRVCNSKYPNRGLGTGGVSLMALRLARIAGCKVIITSSSDAKLETIAKVSGAGTPILTINYSKNVDWDKEAVRMNGGVGVDIVVENGGTSSIMKSLNAVAKRGIISQVGYLGKQSSQDLEGLLPQLIDKAATFR